MVRRPPHPSNRGRTYQIVGAILFVLGVLYNLVGTAFGAAPANIGFGFLIVIAGAYYWIRGRRLTSR